jgi:hypothetical protein
MKEYSNSGNLITDQENADYLNGMNESANDAQFDIIRTLPIKERYDIIQSSGGTGFNDYTLPANCDILRFITYTDENGTFYNRFTTFMKIDNTLKIPKLFGGTFKVYYYKKPTVIKATTPDSYEFEVEEEAQNLIPYYMGAMAKFDENTEEIRSVSAKLLSIYNSRLMKLRQKDDDYPKTIQDVYGVI